MKRYGAGVLAGIGIALLLSIILYRTFWSEDNNIRNYGPVTWSEETEALAETICSGKQEDREKAHALYEWVIANIEYDDYYDAQYQYFDAAKTLTTKKGVCFDFANLYAALCRSQNIPCCILDGYRRGAESEQHTWNRVYYDGVWWNLDLSFDSVRRAEWKSLYGFLRVGEQIDSPDEEYVFIQIY